MTGSNVWAVRNERAKARAKTTCRRCFHKLDRHDERGCTEMAGSSLCKCSTKGQAA